MHYEDIIREGTDRAIRKVADGPWESGKVSRLSGAWDRYERRFGKVPDFLRDADERIMRVKIGERSGDDREVRAESPPGRGDRA